MQPRKNSLPIILAVIVAVLLLVSCIAVLVGAGVIAWLVPVRSVTSIPTDIPVVATVEVVNENTPTPSSSLSGLPIYDVKVEIGVGSPALVEVVASGRAGSRGAS